jgi:hypothetical protein
MQLAGIKFVELPLHSDGARSNVLGLEAHKLAPADSRETIENDRDELVVASREQRRSFSDKHDADCGRHRLLRSPAAGTTITTATTAAARGRVGLADALLHCIGQDEMKRRPPGLNARNGIPSCDLSPLPSRHGTVGDGCDWDVLERW